jgi:hypothetical protein
MMTLFSRVTDRKSPATRAGKRHPVSYEMPIRVLETLEMVDFESRGNAMHLSLTGDKDITAILGGGG